MRMVLLQLGEGFTNLFELLDMRDRDLEATLLDKRSEFGQHLGRRGLHTTLIFDPIFFDGFMVEVYDRIDAVGLYAQLDGKIHITMTVGIDKGVDPAAGRRFDLFGCVAVMVEGNDPFLF